MNKNSIQHVLIAGRGFTPVLTAVFLQKKWGPLAPRVTLLQCGENTDPPVINCVSSIKEAHREMGIGEKDFVRKTKASFHLGTVCQFPGQPDFFICEAPYGVSIHSVRFNHWFARYRQAGKLASFDDFCINAQLAKRGRFAPPTPNPESVYSRVCYGYKLLSDAYTRYLGEQLGAGSTVIREDLESVEAGAEGIRAIRLKNGSIINADLYIDCTSEHKLKRFVADEFKSNAPAPSWHIEQMPQPRLGPPYNQLSVSVNSLNLTTELHGEMYRQKITWEFSQPPQWLRDPEPWRKNCLTLGPATADRPALLVDPVHLTTSNLYSLYRSWPANSDFHISTQTFNNSFNDEWVRIADSDSLYTWAASGRNDDYLTDAARHRMRIFASDGRIPPYENETLMEDQWAALFFALGIMPEVADPLTLEADDEWVISQLNKFKKTLEAAAEHAPPLELFYRENVGSQRH